MYIDTLISVFVIMVFLALIMTFLPVFMLKYQLDMAAQDIARGIAVTGIITPLDAEQLTEEYGLVIDGIEIAAASDARVKSVDDGQIIQLSDSFTVTVYSHADVGVGGIVGSAALDISSTAKGRSEVFWKEIVDTV